MNAVNVDDAGGIIRRRGLLQQRCNELGEIEDAVEVKSEDSGEGFGGVFVVGGTPVRAGVVDQDVELWGGDGC